MLTATDTNAEQEKEKPQGVAGEPLEDILEVDKSGDRTRARNYSFADKMSDPKKAAKFETVEVDGMGEVSIPATIGSTYWAILRIMYERANKPVYPDQLVKLVAELMEDAFPDRWDSYTGKAETTVYKRVEAKRDRQKIRGWQDRVINNAKTLTRVGGTAQYGMRLKERGHLLRFEYDAKKRPCFILHTKIPARPAKQDTTPVEAA